MIIDRVVLGRLAPRALAWLVVVVGVYGIADLADALARPVPWSRLPLRVPAMVFQGLPVALAAAAAHAVTALRRTGEWTAIAAAGIGTARTLRGVVAVAALASLASWGLGDAVAPAAARAYRAAGGGAPPGAVVLPMPAADWDREGTALVRAGAVPLRVSFGHPGPPRIEPGRARAPVRTSRPASDLSRAELLALERRAADALPYALEASFRPLVASAAFLLPVLVLSLVGRRPFGPRGAALTTALACLGAYAVIACAHAMAASGATAPGAAALAAAMTLAAAALVIGGSPVTR